VDLCFQKIWYLTVLFSFLGHVRSRTKFSTGLAASPSIINYEDGSKIVARIRAMHHLVRIEANQESKEYL